MTASAAEPPAFEPVAGEPATAERLTAGPIVSGSARSEPATSEPADADGSRQHPQRGTTEGADRVATLSDGVFAIAMTLLALDLKPPVDLGSAKLGSYLFDNRYQYLTFVIAFLVIARYWVVHHQIMRTVKRVDLTLIWTNMLVLFAITLVPLTTYLQGNFSSAIGAEAFGGNLILILAASFALAEVIRRHHLEDARTQTDAAGYLRITCNLLVPVIVMAVAPLTDASVTLLYLLFIVADIPANRLQRRRDRARAARRSAPAA